MKAAGRLVALVGALAICGVLSACGGTYNMAAQEHVITVNASAEVKVVPDRASFSITILTQGSTAEEASSANTDPTNAVIEQLKAAGIAEEDIQTTYTELSPVYGWGEIAVDDGAVIYPVGGNEIVGYEMRTIIEVTGVEIDDVAALMQTCIGAGATGVDGPRYYVSSYDEAYADALAQAIKASREKAQVMASAAGVTLGQVISITEGYQYTGYRYSDAKESPAMADEAGGMAEMEIAPGQVNIEAQVTVSYAI
ncbi:MAG TPA: SIMPL domain-containing protein [Atopobiaceae bacterium]|nr:SIMPL domain-containing protein [Atopobiaceae bacterium]